MSLPHYLLLQMLVELLELLQLLQFLALLLLHRVVRDLPLLLRCLLPLLK